MKKKIVPYVFLGVLMIILFFILGVRHGQNVERSNKVFNMIVSIPPSPTTNPTSAPLEFATFTHETCGIKFLHPSLLQVDKNSSNGAMLKEKNTIKLSFDCDAKRTQFTAATNAARLAFQRQTVIVDKKNNMYLFALRHPRTGRQIVISIDLVYYPLIEKSLEFF